METGETVQSAEFGDRKRLIFSLAGAVLIASADFAVVFFLFAWLPYRAFTRPETLPHFLLAMMRGGSTRIFQSLVPLIPLLVVLPVTIISTLAARKRRAARKTPASRLRFHRKTPIQT
jgi:hypothetical protein